MRNSASSFLTSHVIDYPSACRYDGPDAARTKSALSTDAGKESHNEFVRDAGNRFRAVPGARREGNVVALYWEMLPTDAETVLGKGLEFVVVSDTGKIVQDYQSFPA
ncbi:hypothetical protein ACFQZO_30290 [Bradyrhizobium sp. GCM10027634]|uniref:hypothetical protein n=1 Tax=unclassified Bradyrhizobium TaxID=2631580 RepID=UPI00263B4B49|nr:hypothetical protein [Bradyrhizobium sp. WYCCWR 12677]MDN5005149.1 hypothetical protein [Bradyrhizobium sp. WYCCWR 12677]